MSSISGVLRTGETLDMSSISRVLPSEVDQRQLKTRKIFRGMLDVILETVCNANTHHLEPGVCKEPGVIRGNISLDEQSTCSPVFFSRYQGTLDDRPFDSGVDVADYRSELSPADNAELLHHVVYHKIRDYQYNKNAPGSYLDIWDIVRFGDILDSSSNWKPSLIALTLVNPESWPRSHDGPEPPLPHVRCLIWNEVIGDDRLLLSEIKAIIKIMRRRLRTKSVCSHLMAPVLLFSIMAPWHIRVLEAYFDGNKLVVRKTPLYDMRENGETILQNIVR